MNSYGPTSQARLETSHIDLQTIFNEVLKIIDHSIFCGHRGYDAQMQALILGKSQLAWPDSKHNQTPSMAVDAGPYFPELKNTDWKDEKAFAFFAGTVMTVARRLYFQRKISHQLIWGGDWDSDGRTRDQRFHDLPHFELTIKNVWNLPDELYWSKAA